MEMDLGLVSSPPPPKDRSLSDSGDLAEAEFCDIHGNSVSDVEQDLDLASIITSPAAQTGCGRDSPYNKVLRENRSFLKNFRLWDGSARGGMSIRNKAFPNRDIHLSFRRCDQLEPFVVLQRIQKGRGRPRIPRFSDFHHYCKRMKSILVVENEDNLCLPRCIVIAISKHEDTVQNYRKLYQSKRRLKAAALSLCDRAKVVIGERGAEVEEIRKFQLSLPDFKITVFADRKGREVIFEGPRLTPDGRERKNIDIIYGDSHFNVISSLSAAFGSNYYCRPCRTAYDHRYSHRCTELCPRCLTSPPCVSRSLAPILFSYPSSSTLLHDRACDSCNRVFHGETCFQNHLLSRNGGKSVCMNVKACPQCLTVIRLDRGRKREHTCGEMFCTTCKDYFPQGHFCYMTPLRKTPDLQGPHVYVFYDIGQNKPSSGGTFLHTPNLLVAASCCDFCISTATLSSSSSLKSPFCNRCSSQEIIFSSENPVNEFISHLKELGNSGFKNITCVAHNAKGYDNDFILKSILEETNWKPEVIMNGTKILSISIFSGRLRFIDSLNFLPMSLGKLPSALGLGDSVAKGYFPHFFNTRENSGYIGSLPSTDFYGLDSMSTKERIDFLEWHGKLRASNYVFNMSVEIREYCVQDVNILRLACLQFRKTFLTSTGVDPFREAITIASACMRVFRKNFLLPNTIAILPPGGYRLADRHSRKALLWLVWEERERGIAIRHAGSRDEKISNSPRETMNMRYEATLKKSSLLREGGYEVVEMWECSFDTMIRDNPGLARFIEGNPLSTEPPINPRDAFFGGRTNCVRLHHKADIEGGEVIRYLDVCSLYPYANKYRKYPIGHPKIFIGEDCLEETEGTCASEESQGECRHTEAERAITGTWVSDEVKVAAREGYRVTRIHEQASGYPSRCNNPESRKNYIKSFFDRERISLDEGAIMHNPGMRQLAKLTLNSFWGRFGMRENLPRCSILRSHEELVSLATDPNVELSRVIPVSEDVIFACWNAHEDSMKALPSENILVACYAVTRDSSSTTICVNSTGAFCTSTKIV
ncbi:hypothetical protein J437_LFUL011157 [Ladona fulva]|uniref:DNA-directed DNA polymerase n=1 Tax=Ladona fulva TaxID=123851 RepID=A0A8K0K5R5_LADFU|nr:hypothetical protein J437_LFUL011157 [Ladona fulva]